MEENTKVIGRITKCTEREYSHGQMAENTQGNMSMIKNKAREDLYGLTVVSM